MKAPTDMEKMLWHDNEKQFANNGSNTEKQIWMSGRQHPQWDTKLKKHSIGHTKYKTKLFPGE